MAELHHGRTAGTGRKGKLFRDQPLQVSPSPVGWAEKCGWHVGMLPQEEVREHDGKMQAIGLPP